MGNGIAPMLAQKLMDQLYETSERMRHVANDALAAAEKLKAENARLRAAARDYQRAVNALSIFDADAEYIDRTRLGWATHLAEDRLPYHMAVVDAENALDEAMALRELETT